MGCNGGLMDYAFTWTEANGITTEAIYPYNSGGGTNTTTCPTPIPTPVFTNTGYTDVTPNSAAALMAAIALRPVSVAIEADQSVFQLYTSGTITGTACGTSLDHGVLAVGYNQA